VIVPQPEAEQPPPSPPAPPRKGGTVFESNEFDQILEKAAQKPTSRPSPKVESYEHEVMPAAEITDGEVSSYPTAELPVAGLPGIFLTTGRLILVSVIVMLLIALSFCAGVFIGRATVATPPAANVITE
jgi:hypothetical protein